MDENAVLILFDIRRYEKHILKLADLARARGAAIVLFTDQWGSPAAAATHTFHAQVEAPSAWDSTIVIMYLIEALIAEVQHRAGGRSRARIEELEKMFSATRLFRSASPPGESGTSAAHKPAKNKKIASKTGKKLHKST